MPPAPPQQRFPIPLPLKGIDRSPAYVAQAAGTYPDGLNVASTDRSDRNRLSKRHGHTRACTVRAGGEAGRRVVGLIPFALATGLIASQTETVETIQEDFSGYTASTTPDFEGTYVYLQRAPSSASNGAPNTDPAVIAGPAMTLQGNGTSRVWLIPNHRTTNDGLIRATASAATAVGTNNIVTAYRIAVRMSDDCTDWIQAGLETNGSNRVRVRVDKQVGATLSNIGFSSDIVLTTSDTSESTDFTLRVIATTTAITVRVTWPTKTADDPLWAGFEYTVENTDLVGNERMGIAGAPGDNGSVDTIHRFTFTRRVPTEPEVIDQLLGTDTESPLTNQYILPTGWTAFDTTSGGTVTSAVGPTSSASAIGVRLWPGVDQTNLRIDGGDSALLSKCILPTTAPPADETHAVELKYPDNDNSGNNFTAFFRVLDAFTGALKIRLTRASAYPAASRLGCFYTAGNIVPTAVVAGVLTSLAASERMNAPFHSRTWLRVAITSTTVTISQNGMSLYTFAYSAAAAWTSSGANTALASATRVGVGPAGATTDGGFGFRVVNAGATSSTAVGEYSNRVLSLNQTGIAQHFRLDDPDTLTTVTGNGTFNALPIGFVFNQKWYIVDGGVSKVIDPAGNTSEDWAASVGTFPSGCRLACLYRGRGVLARTTEQPSIWYMSRVFDLTDFDIGAAPEETSAVAGTDPDIGTPGDAITALVPFNDDLLFFMCATSIYVLEGDPGYGGAVQNVSTEAGCVGPRAWCFDDKGNLYFMGPRGIYKIMRGTRDIGDPIDGGRVPASLDNINLDENLVQLTFDKNTGDLYVWITPTDGVTAGTHIRINTQTLAIHPIQLPLELGPWAACQITGVEDRDRRYLLGGNDGYIRRPDDDAYGDDADTSDVAYPIDSWVEVGPFQFEMGDVEVTANELNAFLASNTTAALSWYWFVGNSPEEVAEQTWGAEVASGTWGPTTGFQTPTGLRQAGGAHKIRFRQTSATGYWALEQVWAYIQQRRRRR